MSGDEKAREGGERRPAPGVGQRIVDGLTSLKFAVALVALIALACVVGTILPQGADAVKYLRGHPEAGGRMELFGFLGLTHVYSAWWFVALLALLASSLSMCTLRRCRAVRRLHGRARGRAVGSALTHVSLLLVLAGGVIRVVWGERGMLSFREGETRNHFMVEGKARDLPFSVHLARFEIETYADPSAAGDASPKMTSHRLHVVWSEQQLQRSIPIKLNKEEVIAPKGETPGPDNSYRLKILRYVPSFVVDMTTREITSRSDVPMNPAILVEVIRNVQTNRQWLFGLHPDFDMHSAKGRTEDLKMRYQVQISRPELPKVKDYKSTLRILKGATVVKEKTIEVNLPLSHEGYTFYQTGYDPKDPSWTSLQVVRDPGVPVVYAGFLLMIVGLTAVFYVCPQRNAVEESGREQEETSA